MELGLEPKTYDMLTKNSPIDLHTRPRNGVCIIDIEGSIEVGDCDVPWKHQYLIGIMQMLL